MHNGMAELAVFFRLSKKDDNREELIYILSELRRAGALSRTMRNGLRLMWDLMCGNVDVLLELFPSIVDRLKPPDDGLKNEIAELRKLILENKNAIPPMRPNEVVMQSTGAGLRNLEAPTFALPVFEDDDDELPTLKLAKSATNNATKNFLNGLQGLH